MKYLFSFIIAVLLSFPSFASDGYRLPFVELQNGVTKIPFVESEWTLGTERSDWLLYIERGMLKERKSMVEFHAVTVYKKPYFSDVLKSDVSKIYTYGVLDCKQSTLHILYEWYVNPDETMIFTSSHEFGAYAVDMAASGTARNEIYNQICKESI